MLNRAQTYCHTFAKQIEDFKKHKNFKEDDPQFQEFKKLYDNLKEVTKTVEEMKEENEEKKDNNEEDIMDVKPEKERDDDKK